MIGPLLLVVGVACAVVAAVLLRGVGSAYRIGRTLSAAPEWSLGEVIAMAREPAAAASATNAPSARYVRVRGRISSEDEFPDEHDRPLVYRRVRLQTPRGRGSWLTFQDDRTAVRFGIEERDTYLAVDIDALGDGLVVVPRIAEGFARDLPEQPDGGILAPDDRVRMRIDQLSAVEHAIVAGVPVVGSGGEPTMTAGAGRPLIVTPLLPGEAMRILGAERRRTVQVAAGLLVVGLGCIALGLVALVFAL